MTQQIPASRTRNRRRDASASAFRRYKRYMTRSEISCCAKYAVFAFNVAFWIMGFFLLSIGVWAQIEKSTVYSQLSKFYMDPAWLLIIIGAIIFMIGFSGCIGALRENTCFLSLYSTILALLLLAEILIFMIAFYAKDVIQEDLSHKLDDMIVLYRDDPDLQTIIDWVQRDFQCCGINDPDDWDKNIYFNSSAKTLASPDAGGVPFSCCKDVDPLFTNYACGQSTRVDLVHRPTRIWLEGCLPKLQNWLNNNFIYVGTIMFIIAIVQCLSICFAQDLRSDIFAQRAKWYHR